MTTEHKPRREGGVYPEHFVTWAISMATFLSLVWGGIKVVYAIGEWTKTVTMQIAVMQTTMTVIDKRLENIENAKWKKP